MTLRATVEQAGMLDRLLLALGGEAWLRRCFARVLARLSEVVGEEDPRHRPERHGAQPSPQPG